MAAELTKAGFAVAARIPSGGLKILADTCRNLKVEGSFYRYDPERDFKSPVAEHNHALAPIC